MLYRTAKVDPSTNFEIIEKIIQDGLSDKTTPRSLLAIYIKLI
jgi:hypothetical protein